MMIDIPQLTQLILDAAEKPSPPGGLDPDEVLFGDTSRLALDSIDALQIAMAIQKKYGVRLNDSKEVRRAMASITNLAQFLAQ